jgi:3-methyladenine DNA glycosylase AlkD
MARYGIPSDNALGVPVGTIQAIAKRIGKNHELAAALWDTGCYEARTIAAFLDKPELVTPAQMDRWCRDFDSWAICDTLCFHLFDRTPHAFGKVAQWSRRRDEFVKRAAFALLACLALHDKVAEDKLFLQCLPLVERGAADERNFVKKGALWALRGIGERNLKLNTEAMTVAKRLSGSAQPAARWVGTRALRELTSRAATKRIGRRRASS